MIAPRPAESQHAGAAPEMRHAVVGQNKKGRFSPKLPYHLASRSASTIAPEILSLFMGNDRTAFNSN